MFLDWVRWKLFELQPRFTNCPLLCLYFHQSGLADTKTISNTARAVKYAQVSGLTVLWRSSLDNMSLNPLTLIVIYAGMIYHDVPLKTWWSLAVACLSVLLFEEIG